MDSDIATQGACAAARDSQRCMNRMTRQGELTNCAGTRLAGSSMVTRATDDVDELVMESQGAVESDR